MRWVLGLAIGLLVCAQARAEGGSWTGSWSTRWRDGGARMDLEQHGRTVTGAYRSYGGRIEGTVDGRTLTGNWIEGARRGGIVFVLDPDGRSFMGRYDNGEWWTGGRADGGQVLVPVDQTGAREALRTFLVAGNVARAGALDALASAAAVVDFGAAGDTLAPGQKLSASRDLFDLVDLTTFQLWPIPGKRATGDHIDLVLHQAGTDASLPLTLRRAADGRWFVAMPGPDTVAAARRSLLARTGGREPAPDAYKRRRSPRDALRSFTHGFYDWDVSGRDEVLGALDLSTFSEATRAHEGDLVAQYLNEILDRVGSLLPQEVPDDPASRQPYVLFSHPSGEVVIAASGSTDAPDWQFNADTVRSARNLYSSIEDMPEAAGSRLPDAPSTFFAIRRWVRGHAPALLIQAGELEAWQAVGVLAILAVAGAVAKLAGMAITFALRRAVGGREMPAERGLRWPLRLAITFILYKVAVPALGLPEAASRFSTGATGVLLAASVVWGGWELIDTLRTRLLIGASRSASALDDIVISLLLGALKLVLVFGGLVFIASELSIPYDGVLAGLGIGGLAVAFASKETLSNVFGAGILVADRPFHRGDSIVAGDVTGTVEHVGIRSTRVRTGDDSLVIVPNGKLSDATVNNLGTRRTRTASAKLLVGYETTVAQVDQFMRGLAEIPVQVPHSIPERAVVGVSKLSPGGIEVELTCVLDVRSGADELLGRNTLLMDVLRLAERLGIRLGEQPQVAAQPMSPAG